MALDLAANHLGLETALIDRLRAQINDLAEVGGAWEYDLAAHAQPGEEGAFPAAYVFYDATVPAPSAGNLPAVQYLQTWIVVLRHRPDPPAKTDSLQKSGPLLARALAALQHWRPEGRYAFLNLESVAATAYAGGLVEFEITLTATLPMALACDPTP